MQHHLANVQTIKRSFSRIMSHSQSSSSELDFPHYTAPFPAHPPLPPPLLKPFRGDYQLPQHPRTAGLFGRLAIQRPLTKSNRLRAEKKFIFLDMNCLCVLLKDRFIRICMRQADLVRPEDHEKFSHCDKVHRTPYRTHIFLSLVSLRRVLHEVVSQDIFSHAHTCVWLEAQVYNVFCAHFQKHSIRMPCDSWAIQTFFPAVRHLHRLVHFLPRR